MQDPPRSMDITFHAKVQECPLCLRAGPHEVVRGADDRRYYRCDDCLLIFIDRSQHPSQEAAVAHYRTHENSIESAGYVDFLRRVIDPLLPYLSPCMSGLDFGCGPGPTLSTILRRHGFVCTDYDPIFSPVRLDPPYDFVFATECFEHFVRPAEDVGRLASLLRPGGYLGVMTERWTDLGRFTDWYYTRDPTHVSFFHDRTFEYVCRRFGFEALPSDDRRVLLFRRIERESGIRLARQSGSSTDRARRERCGSA